MALELEKENKSTGGTVNYHAFRGGTIAKNMKTKQLTLTAVLFSYLNKAERDGEGRSTQQETLNIPITEEQLFSVLETLGVFTFAKNSADSSLNGAIDAV